MAVASPFLGGFVLELPFVSKRIGRFGQPFGIIPQRLNLDAGKVFDRARRRMSQRLQQTEADQDSDVIRLKPRRQAASAGVSRPGNTGRFKISLRSGFIEVPW